MGTSTAGSKKVKSVSETGEIKLSGDVTLSEGSNVTLTQSGQNIEIASTGGASTDAFKTISVAGQNDVVADSSTDTLTLVDGTNVTMTTDDATDTVTINATGGASAIDDLSDVDTTTDTPNNNEVLKWNGSNWVPAAYDYDFAFSIASFSDGISDTSQLIGSGVWSAIGAISFTATYNNEPGGMTADVAMSGASSAWAGDLSMTPTTGPETNTEAVNYPSATGGTVTFTLSQSEDGTTDVESVTFNNTMRYGNSALTQGNQTEASLEALTEVSGPSESRTQTISNISTTANYLVFGYADRLSDIQQIRRNHDGQGYITASFNATRTTVAPSVQTGVTSVDNSAGYSETFACITATDTGLADGSDDFQMISNTTAQNYLYWGELNKSSSYTESDVESNFATAGRTASNTISSRSMTVNCAVDEYVYIAYPTRLGSLSSIVIGGFESISDFTVDSTSLAITNDAGFTEDYTVYVSNNPGFTDPTTMTVSL